MNTCGTCKHFGDKITDFVPGVREQEDIQAYHTCNLLQHMNEDESKRLTALAGVIDGSGYFAAFCVKEEFGCVEWSPSPAAGAQP